MCFSPQLRTIFQHLNFQKWSRIVSFLTFSLPNVLFATAACNFWFLLWAPTSAPAALTGLLFDWPDTRIIEKTQHFATSLTFGADVSSFFWLSRYCIFCRLTWRLYCWNMHLLFNCPYCRKFLFKLPSMIIIWFIQKWLASFQSCDLYTVHPFPGRSLLVCWQPLPKVGGWAFRNLDQNRHWNIGGESWINRHPQTSNFLAVCPPQKPAVRPWK